MPEPHEPFAENQALIPIEPTTSTKPLIEALVPIVQAAYNMNAASETIRFSCGEYDYRVIIRRSKRKKRATP